MSTRTVQFSSIQFSSVQFSATLLFFNHLYFLFLSLFQSLEKCRNRTLQHEKVDDDKISKPTLNFYSISNLISTSTDSMPAQNADESTAWCHEALPGRAARLLPLRRTQTASNQSGNVTAAGSTRTSLTPLSCGRKGTVAKSATIYTITTGTQSLSARSVSSAFHRTSSAPIPTRLSVGKGSADMAKKDTIFIVTTEMPSACSVSSTFRRSSSAPTPAVTSQVDNSGKRFSKANLTRIKSLPSGPPPSSNRDLQSKLSFSKLLVSSQLKSSIDLLKYQITSLRVCADEVLNKLQPICNSPTATSLTTRNSCQMLCPIRVNPTSESVQFFSHRRNDSNEDAGLLPAPVPWDSAKQSAKEKVEEKNDKETSLFQPDSTNILFPVCTRLVPRGVNELESRCRSPNFGSPKIRYLPGVGRRYVRTHKEQTMVMIDPLPLYHSAEPKFTFTCGTVAQTSREAIHDTNHKLSQPSEDRLSFVRIYSL